MRPSIEQALIQLPAIANSPLHRQFPTLPIPDMPISIYCNSIQLAALPIQFNSEIRLMPVAIAAAVLWLTRRRWPHRVLLMQRCAQVRHLSYLTQALGHVRRPRRSRFVPRCRRYVLTNARTWSSRVLYFRRCNICSATSASNICQASIVCQHLPVTSAQASNICQHHLPTSAAHCTQSQ